MGRIAFALGKVLSVSALHNAKREGSDLDGAEDLASKLDEKLSSKYCRIYSLRPKNYGDRGGFPYFKPNGWVRFAVLTSAELLRTWPVAYHGTSIARAARIIA